ncbi:MAG: hypothetical protein WC050_02695 [Candidatus Paceibacterota bacterium]
MPAKKRRILPKPVHPVDAHFDAKISQRADQARHEKETKERIRLAPRRRITKVIFAVMRRELGQKTLVGLLLSDTQLIKIAEDRAKNIARDIGVEPINAKKDKE